MAMNLNIYVQDHKNILLCFAIWKMVGALLDIGKFYVSMNLNGPGIMMI